MPLIVELLKGFAPKSVRSAIEKYGQEHPGIVAKYTGDFDAYVPFVINDVEVMRECEQPKEKTSIFNWNKSQLAKEGPAIGLTDAKLRCFRVRPTDESIPFTGVQLRFRTNMESAFPDPEKYIP